MNNQLDPLTHAKDTLLDLAIRFGPKLLVAILILTVGFFVAGWAGRVIHGSLRRFDLEPPVRQLLTRVVRVLVGLWLVIYGADLSAGYAFMLAILGTAIAVTGIADICPMELVANAKSSGPHRRAA